MEAIWKTFRLGRRTAWRGDEIKTVSWDDISLLTSLDTKFHVWTAGLVAALVCPVQINWKHGGEMFKRVKPRDLFGLFKNFVESALLCAWLWRWNENRGMFVQFGGDEGVRRYVMMWSEGGFEDDVAEAEVPWLEMSLFCSLRYTLWPQFPLFRKES